VTGAGGGETGAGGGGFDPGAYGRRIAVDYDATTGTEPAEDAVAALLELAEGGAVLELGIGTGRLALPLARAGLEVHGIEGSPEMVEQLRRKPGGDRIPVVVGDFTTARVEQTFDLAVLAYNTIFALPSQDAQVACFANAARHLRPGGAFVVEAWVPDLGAFRAGRAIRPVTLAEGRVVLEVAEIHPAEQTMRTNKVFLDGAGVRVFPANHRYAWPAELDLMARLAGLSLAQRWEDWTRRPYDDRSPAHVSVYRRAPDPD
jgi:SAM-dependent methyltransferase